MSVQLFFFMFCGLYCGGEGVSGLLLHSLHSKSFRSNCCEKVGFLRAKKRDALVPTFLTNSPEN